MFSSLNFILTSLYVATRAQDPLLFLLLPLPCPLLSTAPPAQRIIPRLMLASILLSLWSFWFSLTNNLDFSNTLSASLRMLSIILTFSRRTLCDFSILLGNTAFGWVEANSSIPWDSVTNLDVSNSVSLLSASLYMSPITLCNISFWLISADSLD